MKQTQKTRVVSGRRRGGSVLARERKGSGSHSGEWSRALLRERESDVSHLHLGHSGTYMSDVDREKTPEPLLSRSSCLQLASRPR